MNRIFTTNDLILFYYQELPKAKHNLVSRELIDNLQLQEQYKELTSDINSFGGMQYSPDDTTIKIILEESMASSLDFIS